MVESDLSLLSSLISATGWMLLHFLWQGCVIAALYWLTCAFSRPESAHMRYWAGLSAYLLAAGTLLTTFVICYEPAAEFTYAPIKAEAVNSFLVLSGSRPDMWSFLQAGIEPALPLVVLLWLAGVLILTVKTGIGWYGTRRWSRVGVTAVGEELQRSVDRMVNCLAVRQTVTVLKSTLVKVPMVIGWIRPVILLPASVIMSLPRNQLEMVIAHELGHIKRYDYLVNLLQIVLETLLFYHPAIRWMSRRVRAEREHCCDDLVVSGCGKPVVYAKALANLEALRVPLEATAMAATGGDLLSRVRRIVDTELPRNGSGYAQVSMMAAVALVVALGAQQGMQLSRALIDIADSARLQVSDVEFATRNRSRAAWGDGVEQFTRNGSFYQAPAVVVEEAPAPAPAVVQAEVTVPAEISLGHTSRPEIIDWSEHKAAVTIDDSAQLAKSEQPPADYHPGVSVSQDQGIEESFERPTVKPIKTSRPRYPWRARMKNQEGYAKLSFSVDSNGKVHDIEVVESWPEDTFDRAAAKALKKWKFEPSPEGSAGSRMVQTFDFNLDDAVKNVSNRRDCAVTGRRTCSRGPHSAIIVYVNPPASKKASS